MTTPRSSPASGEPTRGRGLDALFEGGRTLPTGSQSTEADLSALLDNEVQAAMGGSAPASARATTSQSRSAVVKPSDSAPQTSGSEPTQPAASTEPPASEAPRSLPVTRRFGAIIMDTSPTSASAAEGAPEVGPAGELISEEQAGEGTAIVVAEPEKAMETRNAAPPGPVIQVTPSGPGSQSAVVPIVIATRPEEEKAAIVARLNDVLGAGWQQKLQAQIDDLFNEVATEFSSPPENAEKAAGLLREAAQLLIESPWEGVAAKYRAVQVHAMLSRTRESRKQARTYSLRVLGYEVGWMVLLLVGLAFAGPVATGLGSLGKMSETVLNDLFPIWNTMMWGGIGGVIGGLYSLWYHVSDQQDFDRQYITWYLVQPIMGLALGGIVFLLLAGGLLIFQVNLADANADTNADTARRLLPYLVGVLAGFRQNFIYQQLDRLIGLFGPPSQNGGGQTGSGSV